MNDSPKQRIDVLLDCAHQISQETQVDSSWLNTLSNHRKRSTISDGIAAALMYGFMQGFEAQSATPIPIDKFEQCLKQNGFNYLMLLKKFDTVFSPSQDASTSDTNQSH